MGGRLMAFRESDLVDECPICGCPKDIDEDLCLDCEEMKALYEYMGFYDEFYDDEDWEDEDDE